MVNFINKLFKNFATSSQNEPPPGVVAVVVPEAPAAPAVVVVDAPLSGIDLPGFVDLVVGHLVDVGTEYRVEADVDSGKIVVRIHCPPGQVGRIIGKNGKTIEAIRLLLRDAASRHHQKAKVVVVEAP